MGGDGSALGLIFGLRSLGDSAPVTTVDLVDDMECLPWEVDGLLLASKIHTATLNIPVSTKLHSRPLTLLVRHESTSGGRRS